MPSDTSYTDLALADLVADAKQMAIAMLPRPRTASPRVIDLTPAQIRIPEATALWLDQLDPYGT